MNNPDATTQLSAIDSLSAQLEAPTSDSTDARSYQDSMLEPMADESLANLDGNTPLVLLNQDPISVQDPDDLDTSLEPRLGWIPPTSDDFLSDGSEDTYFNLGAPPTDYLAEFDDEGDFDQDDAEVHSDTRTIPWGVGVRGVLKSKRRNEILSFAASILLVATVSFALVLLLKDLKDRNSTNATVSQIEPQANQRQQIESEFLSPTTQATLPVPLAPAHPVSRPVTKPTPTTTPSLPQPPHASTTSEPAGSTTVSQPTSSTTSAPMEPEEPTQLLLLSKLVKATESSVEIHIAPSSQDFCVKEYTYQIDPGHGPETRPVSAETCTDLWEFAYADLKPDSKYYFRINAESHDGKRTSSEIFFTTKSASS